MNGRKSISILAIALLTATPGMVSSQVDPGYGAFRMFEILDPSGIRLGMTVVVGRSGRGFEAGNEYWSFSEEALREIAHQESLEFAVVAAGEWDDPWVEELLDWKPVDHLVSWTHPTEVEWSPQEQMLPPIVAEGTYFGHATLGGLTIQYSQEGPASLTWFKTTEGAFMQLEDGGLFERSEVVPKTGSWWHGAIEHLR